MSFDNNDDEEDNQNDIDYEKLENARYMKMARSRSRKQSKLFSQRKKVNLPKIENSKQLFNEIYRNKRLHGPIYILTETSKKYQKPKGYNLFNANFLFSNFPIFLSLSSFLNLVTRSFIFSSSLPNTL